jgi:hypothetical protein
VRGTFGGVSGSGGSGGQSVLRHAVESLLRAHADVERALDGASGAATDRVARVAEIARQAGHPVARSAADDVAAMVPVVDRALAELTAATGTVLTQQVHTLLDLLAVNHHGLPSLPALDVAPISVPGGPLIDAFPEGFARSYVATVLGDLSSGRATSKGEAAGHPGAQQADIDVARDRIVDAVAPEHRVQVREWLSHPDCHAVEIHGPQVGDRELELRAGWTRPPDHGTEGADKWRVRQEDQKVVSKHSTGPEATRFNSPEAFARPLDALLSAASHHPGGIDQLLTDHAFGGRVAIYVTVGQAGLSEGDTFGYRGAGTGTAEAATDWTKMRGMAMKKDGECMPPVRTLAYDPTSHGRDPGVRLVFAEGDDGWTMITQYPAGSPRHDNKRLEDIT